MLSLEGPQPVFPLEAGINSAVCKRGLEIEVQLSSPPGGRAVLKLRPVGVKVVAGALGAKSREILNLKIPGLLEIVVISYEVRPLLSGSGVKQEQGETGQHET